MLFGKIILCIIGGFIMLVLFVFIISCLIISSELDEGDDKK